MAIPWVWLYETSLVILVVGTLVLAGFIVTLPRTYNLQFSEEITKDDFTTADKEDAERSGYANFEKLKNVKGALRIKATVQVVVLGDIGRSPRMQYHALSLARYGGKVQLIGYVESELHPDVKASRLIEVIPISPFPKWLQTNNRLLFLALAPLKVLWQVASLYYTLGYGTKACGWMLVQNPPSIPTLAVAQWMCLLRDTRLVVDWHNFGYSILALRLGAKHPLVRIARWYEGFFSRSAYAHFAVTNAMCNVLRYEWQINALPLHDRPPNHFQPLTRAQCSEFLSKLPETSQYAIDIQKGAWRLLISSTSWTPDEDFSVLLDALVKYSQQVSNLQGKPKILAIITGKGPQKEHYLSLIKRLNQENKLQNVVILTAWLSSDDYASLLGSADLGVSLHTSSSGVDLPMKVVDMFGTGLPVAGWSKFEAWPELVHEGLNGRGFDSADGLANILHELFGDDGSQLKKLKQGALRECDRRWDDEWLPVAGKLFRLKV
ncbi:glycosyltransferase family 33 protein [Acrodontium crateriforme]|uniref:Chitobiosyldiphosphodolichol beta-mannosyltransferase n=1 Tax=Acrodontium crateriforme TaxID=150365 RepID=A0AAQ3M639_9PEZI|nr:glycosyltransferase family 33 protein [Acrodontium crateriforme]